MEAWYMKNGYTLIEVLVAVGIFTIIIAAPTGFFVGSLKGQLKTLASQKLLDNTSYALEYISRSLRMAKKELNCSDINTPTTCSCLKSNGYGFNYENPEGDLSAIRFINYKDECQEFFLDESDHRLKESKNGATPIALTAEDLEITSLAGPGLKFKLSGESQTDNDQPRVTLFLKIKGAKGQKPELQPEIKIQTTISQRNLDVPY